MIETGFVDKEFLDDSTTFSNLIYKNGSNKAVCVALKGSLMLCDTNDSELRSLSKYMYKLVFIERKKKFYDEDFGLGEMVRKLYKGKDIKGIFTMLKREEETIEPNEEVDLSFKRTNDFTPDIEIKKGFVTKDFRESDVVFNINTYYEIREKQGKFGKRVVYDFFNAEIDTPSYLTKLTDYQTLINAWIEGFDVREFKVTDWVSSEELYDILTHKQVVEGSLYCHKGIDIYTKHSIFNKKNNVYVEIESDIDWHEGLERLLDEEHPYTPCKVKVKGNLKSGEEIEIVNKCVRIGCDKCSKKRGCKRVDMEFRRYDYHNEQTIVTYVPMDKEGKDWLRNSLLGYDVAEPKKLKPLIYEISLVNLVIYEMNKKFYKENFIFPREDYRCLPKKVISYEELARFREEGIAGIISEEQWKAIERQRAKNRLMGRKYVTTVSIWLGDTIKAEKLLIGYEKDECKYSLTGEWGLKIDFYDDNDESESEEEGTEKEEPNAVYSLFVRR